MWRKLLIVCVLAAIPLEQGTSSIATDKTGRITHAVSPASNAGATPQVGREARRVALVIGNGDYADDPLANPINDARAMSNTLEMLGFKVLHYENLTQQRMHGALVEFNRRLGAGGVGLFYFSGHGLRTADKTLLAPINLDRRSPARLLTHSIDLQTVLDSMSKSRPDKLNLIVLDTCLNNPFQGGEGRAIDTPEQTLIAYATAPGSLAADETRHGLYTAELLKALAVPGQDVAEMFGRVAASVRQTSNQRQVPWVSSSLSNDFRFALSSRRPPVQKRPPLTRSGVPQPEPVLVAQGRGIRSDAPAPALLWEMQR